MILNGAPRSGKSSIAAVIQDTSEGVWINLGVDRYMQMTPEKCLPGIGLRPGGERPDLEPLVFTMYLALYESISAHSRLGLNVVADVGHHDAYSVSLGILPACARLLDGLPAVLVGVRCPIEIITERRRETGWNRDLPPDAPIPEPIGRWQLEVHRPGDYDLEVDTSVLAPGECAAAILERLKRPPHPTALQRIASSA